MTTTTALVNRATHGPLPCRIPHRFLFVLDFSKTVLNKKVDLKDLETGDSELYKGLLGVVRPHRRGCGYGVG